MPWLRSILLLNLALVSSAHACRGATGLDDLTLANLPADYYAAGEAVTCWAPGAIEVRAVTFSRATNTHLAASRVALNPGTAVAVGAEFHVYTRLLRLNDTGITDCLDMDANRVACPAPGMPGQDGDQGRDALFKDDGDGWAGFHFTKLDAQGNPLPPTATAWSCVRDEVTGLVWEVKQTDGGLHQNSDVFSWYRTQPVATGFADEFGDCQGYDAADPSTFCNTEAYVARVNAQGLCGAHDWRLPEADELMSIVDLGVDVPGPTIDTTYFPNTLNAYYWTATQDVEGGGVAWTLYFWNGALGAASGEVQGHVRLVRRGETP